MKIAVTGHRGKIGKFLVGYGAEPLDCDILKPDDIRRELDRVQPDIVIHAAAVSSIDLCQRNYTRAVSVNAWGTNKLCELAENKVVLLSSEQVFDGKKGNYSEDDEPNPINDYGLTKLAAEGIVSMYGGKVIRLSRGVKLSDEDIKCNISGFCVEQPDFIYRSYAHISFLAERIMQFAQNFHSMPNLLHIAGSETVSCYDFMSRFSPMRLKARKIDSGETPRPYKCGLNTKLSKKLGFAPITLKMTIEKIRQEHKLWQAAL